MKLYEAVAQKNLKKLRSVSAVLLFCAAAVMAVTLILQSLPYRWIFQLIALCMLGVAIFFISRYVMKNYVYSVTASEDTSTDLCVTEIQGRHTITVCRISVSGIEEVITVDRADKAQHESVTKRIKTEKRKIYDYCGDMFGEKYICVLSQEYGEPLAIKLSFDEELLKLIAV